MGRSPARFTVRLTPTDLKTIALLMAMVVTQVLGDIWLSRSMKVYGAIEAFHGAALWELFLYLLTSPWIWLGVGMLLVSLFFYFTATSRLDLSLVLPLFSSSYILNALLAWLMLGEAVSPPRWFGTCLIACGVFIVCWSEHQQRLKSISAAPQKATVSPLAKRRSPFWLMPLGWGLSRVWGGILMLIFTDSAGDVLMARGMKQLGPVQLQSPLNLIKLIGRILSHPSVLAGIGCQTLSFAIFIALLSWDDVSLIRPAGALGYVISLLGAKFLLHEHISPARWLGVGVISGGVALIALDEINLVDLMLPWTL